MSFLLDTNICSAYLRHPGGLFHRFTQHYGRLHLSTITFAELYAWAYKQEEPGRITNAVDQLLEIVPPLAFDLRCAEILGRLRGEHLRCGISFSPIDLMIASTAFAHNLTLVTHNVKDFEKIPDLRIEDWIQT